MPTRLNEETYEWVLMHTILLAGKNDHLYIRRPTGNKVHADQRWI